MSFLWEDNEVKKKKRKEKEQKDSQNNSNHHPSRKDPEGSGALKNKANLKVI